jgi:hypothetical protein
LSKSLALNLGHAREIRKEPIVSSSIENVSDHNSLDSQNLIFSLRNKTQEIEVNFVALEFCATMSYLI